MVFQMAMEGGAEWRGNLWGNIEGIRRLLIGVLLRCPLTSHTLAWCLTSHLCCLRGSPNSRGTASVGGPEILQPNDLPSVACRFIDWPSLQRQLSLSVSVSVSFVLGLSLSRSLSVSLCLFLSSLRTELPSQILCLSLSLYGYYSLSSVLLSLHTHYLLSLTVNVCMSISLLMTALSSCPATNNLCPRSWNWLLSSTWLSSPAISLLYYTM